MKKAKMHLDIKYFKSIKRIKDINLYCNQINYFIGENNSGKSNIFDALLFYKNQILKYKPEINEFSDEANKINRENIQTKIVATFEYGENDRIKIKKIINKIFPNLKIEKILQENDYKLEWFNKGETTYFVYPILNKISIELDKNSSMQSYLAFKKSKRTVDLFEKGINFLNDLEKSTSSSLKNDEIKNILKNLDSLKKIVEKNFIIYSSKESFQIKDEYNLKVLLQKSNEPGYDIEVKKLVDYLILETGITFDEILMLLKSSSSNNSSFVTLSKKIKHRINSKLSSIFNNYFGEELNCDLNVEIESQILSLSIIPRKNYLFNDITLKSASDGLNKIIRSILRLEMLKHNLNENKNDIFILIIDEPEQNLNPLVQSKYVELLNKEVNELNNLSNFFVLLSTHSLNIIPSIDIEKIPSFINFVERKPGLETHIVKNDSIDSLSNANKYLIEKIGLINSKFTKKDFVSKMKKVYDNDPNKLNNIFEAINTATDLDLPIFKIKEENKEPNQSNEVDLVENNNEKTLKNINEEMIEKSKPKGEN